MARTTTVVTSITTAQTRRGNRQVVEDNFTELRGRACILLNRIEMLEDMLREARKEHATAWREVSRALRASGAR